jgi:hypothetical protein
MKFGYIPQILETLAAANIVPNDEHVELQLWELEKQMRANLQDIVERAQDLIKDIDAGRVGYVADRIADGAGASGPINSKYARVIGQAAEMNSLIRFATTREVK